MNLDRRTMLGATAGAFAALLAHRAVGALPEVFPYGPLVADPKGVLDLPNGFSWRLISQLGDRMDDGETVPDRADGMGCFALPGGRLALVRNHELKADQASGGVLASGYDRTSDGRVLPGGTTTLVLDAVSLTLERQYRSLAGTIRNCAGGVTPWGSWLSCEEDLTLAGQGCEKDHGWVFEVPVDAAGLVEARPLTAMGRFNHEAAAVDPASGMVYLTEDRKDGLLYRFVPRVPGQLAEGGRLQALALADGAGDIRNLETPELAVGGWRTVRWIDLDGTDAPQDDLRNRGAAAGACRFARGEGIHMGEGELYFCCTSGGAAGLGQVFRLKMGGADGADRLQLFFESRSHDEFDFGDNLTIAPSGHLVICEDQGNSVVDNHLRGLTPEGRVYPIGRLRLQTELAGACFAPDGRTLFVNIFSPAMTVAITGPWMV